MEPPLIKPFFLAAIPLASPVGRALSDALQVTGRFL